MTTTGENEQGLHKILDWTRMISILLLLIHYYYYCYALFYQWHLFSALTDRLLANIQTTGLFQGPARSKLLCLAFLMISLFGSKGKPDDKRTYKSCGSLVGSGGLLYFSSSALFSLSLSANVLAVGYIILTSLGYILLLTGGTFLSRIITQKLNPGVFNSLNETFPQEERLLENEYSMNLPARYNLKGRIRPSWINFINPFRGLLIMGTPGSGKSYFIVQHIIKQHIQKGFSLFVYDFKYDDLTKIAYNYFLKYKNRYKVTPEFYAINFDDLSRSHRCNPLDPTTLIDLTDAAESARTIMLGLNKEWIKKNR